MAPKVQKIKCKGTSRRTGLPCNNWAIKGALVCNTHGGAAPQVKNAARERLKGIEEEALEKMRDLLPKAMTTLSEIMESPTARPQDQQRAAETIIDRFIPRKVATTVEDTREDRDLDREINELIEQRKQEAG